MKIVEYAPEYYFELSEWFIAWDEKVPSAEHLPRLGIMIEGVAAGFLVQTDTKICLIDFLISNPKAEKKERNKALNLVVHALIKLAQNLGYNLIMANTKKLAVKNRALKHEFKYIGEYASFVRGI